MTELDPETEQRVADLSDDDFAVLVARTRPPDEESGDPKAVAAAALKRHMGADRRGSHPSKQDAASALREIGAGRRNDARPTKEQAGSALRAYSRNR